MKFPWTHGDSGRTSSGFFLSSSMFIRVHPWFKSINPWSALLIRTAIAATVFALECLAAEGPKLLSIRLAPEQVTLWGPQSAQHFLVLGKYSDGLERDITASARFALESTELFRVDSSGRATPLADGETILKAELDGHSAQSKIAVQEFKTQRQPSFVRDIASILTMQGCNASKCHGAVAGKDGFKLSLYGSHLREDYQWIIEGGAYHVLTDKDSGRKLRALIGKNPKRVSCSSNLLTWSITRAASVSP